MVNASCKVRATTHNMVSHATCTKGDNFSATYTENHTVEYPSQIELFSIEYSKAKDDSFNIGNGCLFCLNISVRLNHILKRALFFSYKEILT